MADNLRQAIHSHYPAPVDIRCSNSLLNEKLKEPPVLRDLVASAPKT